VFASVGGPDRWQSMPRVVLIAVQAFACHAGCTLCLPSAAISITIVPIAWREAPRPWSS
jgi:hypothetical protein